MLQVWLNECSLTLIRSQQARCSLVVVVAGLSVVGVLGSVVVVALDWVLVAESVMGCRIVLALVVRHHSVILVVDGSGVRLVLQLDVRLLLVRVVGGVRVEVGGHLVVDRVVVHDARLVVVLVLRHALNEVMRLLVVELVVQVIVAEMVFTQVVMMDQALIVVSVVTFVDVVRCDDAVRQGCVMGGDDVVGQCGCVVRSNDIVGQGCAMVRSDDFVSGIVDEILIILALLVVVVMTCSVVRSDISVGIGGVVDKIFVILALLVVVVMACSVVRSDISVGIGGVVDEIFVVLALLVVLVMTCSVVRSDISVGIGGVVDEIFVVLALLVGVMGCSVVR